jgi:hypothetical protein
MMDAKPLDPDKVALFDMDETLVDFQGPLREALATTLGPDEAMPTDLWDMPDHMYRRGQFIKRVPGFWRNLPKLKWGNDVLDIAREIGYDIHVLTKGPTTGSLAWKEKVDWVRAEMPDATLHITDDKRIAYGRVFVDDYWPFMELWLQNRPRGLGVVNYSSDKHPNLVSYDDGLEVVRDRLQEAYDR